MRIALGFMASKHLFVASGSPPGYVLRPSTNADRRSTNSSGCSQWGKCPAAVGLCQSAGRVGAFVAIPSFLWIQQGFGLTAVFVVIAVIVVIAAVAVTQIGPEAKGLALDEIAPPTA